MHEAPGDEGAPIHDLTFNGVFPPEVYDRPDWYAAGHPSDAQAWGVVSASRGKPARRVVVYRAVPKGTRYINPGDWVAITKRYAIDHARSEGGDMVVISTRVRAREIFTLGDSLQEWGFGGDAPVRATVVYRVPRPLTEEQKIQRLQSRQRKRSIERARERSKGWLF
jgi:hypothetical protein